MERNKADCLSRPVCLCCWAQGAPNKLGALGSLAIQRFCCKHVAFPWTSHLSSPRLSSPISDAGLPLVVPSEQRPQKLKRRSGGCAGRFANLDESTWPSEGVASVILGFRLVIQGSERFRHLTWVTQDFGHTEGSEEMLVNCVPRSDPKVGFLLPSLLPGE